MMKHVRLKQSRVLGEFPGRESEEIGSYRSPSPQGRPGSMPSVGTRSSTRIFVPKNISKVSADGLRVLRSGKRLFPLKIFGRKAVSYTNGDAKNPIFVDQHDSNTRKEDLPVDDFKVENHVEKTGECEEDSEITTSTPVQCENDRFIKLQEKSFGVFYSRKRRRPHSSNLDSPSSVSTSNDFSDGSIPLTTESSDFSNTRYGVVFVRKPRWKRLRLSTSEASTNLRFGRTLRIPETDPWFEPEGTTILLILINSITRTGSDRLTRLILSLLTGILQKNISLFKCAAFFSSGALPRVFSGQGIDFLPVRDWNNDFLLRTAAGDCGLCILFGACQSIPLVSIDFSALPFFFTSIHFQILGESLLSSASLLSLEVDVSLEERRLFSMNGQKETRMVYGCSNNQPSVSISRSPLMMPSATSKLKKAQRKSRPFNKYRKRKSRPKQNCLLANENLSYPDTYPKRRKIEIKGSVSKSAVLAEADQNAGFLCCTANVLVIESDRCWREEGASVALELSNSNKWYIAVRSGSAIRYIYNAEEIKINGTNRFTNSVIWPAETGWKLEFCLRKDWIMFKELQKQCFERNLEVVIVKVIPIPGVREVPGYEESFTSLYSRPSSYIRTVGEVERARKSKWACYDMDSEDEDWLEQLNSDQFAPFSVDAFENIIFALEKTAYDCPDGPELEQAVKHCSDFGGRDVAVSVFEYWKNKRKQRQSALVKFFQARSEKKAPLTQSLLRKRRSFKKQASHVGRGKYDVPIEGGDREGVIKVQTAEARSNKAVCSAVRLRTRAQWLMASVGGNRESSS